MATGTARARVPSTKSTSKKVLGKLLLSIAVVWLALVVVVAAFILSNNFSIAHPTRTQFTANLDSAINASTEWMSNHPELMNNPPLTFMVSDMARTSNDPRMHGMVAGYMRSKRVRQPGEPITWFYARLVDGTTEVPRLTIFDARDTTWQNRIDAFAVAPQKVELTTAERTDLFSPTKFRWGSRYHQLVALDMYRYFNGDSPELASVMTPVTQGVVNDQRFDFRVNDSYPQRLWTILGAGRPDLIRARWVERLMSYQRSDGSWDYCWYGWCKGIVEFHADEQDSAHTTVQAAYTLYLIKYRYPEWIAEHYH